MSNFWMFANPAEPEEQGGHCDTGSQIHYCNESEDEMKNNSSVHAEHTGNPAYVRDEAEAGGRYNTTILETDRLGAEHPAKYAPGG